MYEATFWLTPTLSQYARYSDSRVHDASTPNRAWLALNRSRIPTVHGPIELPSPKICVVTPCFSSDSDRGSYKIDAYEWLSMLTKPGATAIPAASISSPATAS